MTVGIGYLTAFDGTTLINHTTRCGMRFADISDTVNDLVDTLPDGTNVYYNGTSDSTVTPGTASQLIYTTTGGGELFLLLIAKLGHYATNLTHVDVASTSSTCAAVMTKCERVGPRDVNPNAKMIISVEFNLITDWS